MSDMRVIVITDIHGCYDELQKLLEKTTFDPGADQLICLGDTIDRGPKIYETFRFFHDLKKEMGERCILIRGNHEQMMLDSVSKMTNAKKNWDRNGGAASRFDFLMHRHNIREYKRWYGSMPYYYEDPRFTCVHASLENEDPSKNDIMTMIWGRRTDYTGKLILTGHTPYKAPVYFCGVGTAERVQEDQYITIPEKGMFALDTGCVYGNRLTAMIIEEDACLVTSVKSDVKFGSTGS